MKPVVVCKHPSIVFDALFSPEGKFIATACEQRDEQGVVRVWTIKGEKVATLKHAAPIIAMQHAHDQPALITADRAGTVRVWSYGDERVLAEWTGRSLSSLQLHPTQNRLAAACGKFVRFWDFAGQEIAPPLKHAKEVITAGYTHRGRHLIGHTPGRQISLWTLGKGAATEAVLKHPAGVDQVSVSNNDRWLITGGKDRWLRLWDVKTGDLTRELARIEKGWFDSLHFSADARLVRGSISFGSMREQWSDVFAFHLKRGEFIYRRRLHERPGTNLYPTRDDQQLLSTSWDKSAHLLDAKTGAILKTFPHPRTVMGGAFHPQQPFALTWGGSEAAYVWDVS